MPKGARRESGPTQAASRSAPYKSPKAPASAGTDDDKCARHVTKSGGRGPLGEKDINTLASLPSETLSNILGIPSDKALIHVGDESSEPAHLVVPPSASVKSFLDTVLPGEDNDAVPLYDTCSQIRTKIKNLLEKCKDKPENGIRGEFTKDGKPKPWTIKAFCDAIGVNQGSYQRFIKAKGHMGGAETKTYYNAYVFFEKKRLFEGGKKTAARQKIEKE